MPKIPRLGVNSKFQIDLNWWRDQGRDFRSELFDALCASCRERYGTDELVLVDRVDQETGEVSRFDAAWDCLIDDCGTDEKFIHPAMPLTRLIFRAFLASGNRPLTPTEIQKRIRKGTPEAILKELLHRSMTEYGISPI